MIKPFLNDLLWIIVKSFPRPSHRLSRRHVLTARQLLAEQACSFRVLDSTNLDLDTQNSEGLLWTRDFYVTTRNEHEKQTSMIPAGFEPAIPASERPQINALDRVATEIIQTLSLGLTKPLHTVYCTLPLRYHAPIVHKEEFQVFGHKQ